MNLSTRLLVLSASILAAAPVARASLIVYDTFGPGNSFFQATGYSISGQSTSPGYISQGFRFKAISTGPGLSLEMAMGHWKGNPPRVTMTLRADNGAGQIGAPIGSPVVVDLNFNSAFSAAAYVSTSLAGSGWTFVSGTDYWLVAEAPATTENIWQFNNQGMKERRALRLSDPSNPWNYFDDEILPAFRLTAVPEPASLLALGAGLAALLARRRRSV